VFDLIVKILKGSFDADLSRGRGFQTLEAPTIADRAAHDSAILLLHQSLVIL
jgi:hypothetical protein